MTRPGGAFSVRMLRSAWILVAALVFSAPVFAAPPADPPEVEALGKKLVDLRGQKADFERPTADVLHQLAGIGTTPAVRHIVCVAGDHNGAMKTEVGKTLKDLGDRAIPALIEARREPSADLRKWAQSQLEGMGKRIAGDAVQTEDSAVLADVLTAFANVRDLDALPVLLSFVNADRAPVREAARASIGQFGQDAIWKVREAYQNVLNHPAPDNASAAQVEKELFAAYDKIRLQEVYGLLESGIKATSDGKLEEAIAAFDKVLARQPMLDRRGEMVPAYVQYALTFEDSDPLRAKELLRKAQRLWPESPRAKMIEGELAYLEGKELLARGITDSAPFERALAADHTHVKARQELAAIENAGDERRSRLRMFAAAGATVVVLLLGLILFGGRRRPRAIRAG